MGDLVLLESEHDTWRILEPTPLYGEPITSLSFDGMEDRRYVEKCTVHGTLDKALGVLFELEQARTLEDDKIGGYSPGDILRVLEEHGYTYSRGAREHIQAFLGLVGLLRPGTLAEWQDIRSVEGREAIGPAELP